MARLSSRRGSFRTVRLVVALVVGIAVLPAAVGTSPALALTDVFPSSYTVETGTHQSGNAASLAADYNDYLVVKSTKTGTKTATWYGTFTGVDNAVTSLAATYKGMSSVTCTQVISLSVSSPSPPIPWG